MKFLKYGFIGAGLSNIVGVLLFSKFFSNEAMNAANPVVMSNFGLLMIIVWGFAYIAVANSYEATPWLSAVFTIEKLIYTLTWIFWFQQNDLTLLYTKDLFAGIFYTLYGLNDFLSMLIFGFAFWISRRRK
jgi:hypothetical protein